MRRWRRKRWLPHEDPTRASWAKEVTLRHRLEPTANGWYWSVCYLFDGRQSCMGYSEGWSRNHPAPYTVAGTCASRLEAHQEMTQAIHAMAERARAANALLAHRKVATHEDVVHP